MKRDFILNIVASFVLTAVVQLVTYPLLAQSMDSYQYGLMLTNMALANACGVSFGTALNNARLLEKNYAGDSDINASFNLLFSIFGAICFIVSLFVVLFYCGASPFDSIMSALISVLLLTRSYYSVIYRIVIDYKKMLIMSIFGAIGYGVGSIISFFFGVWELPFILGEFVMAAYTLKEPVLREAGISKSALFSKALSVSLDLLWASIIANIAVYIDRLILLPLLGADCVTIYTVASLLGKMFAIVASPIASVLLTYYAKEDTIQISDLITRTAIICILSAACFLVVILLNEPILAVLYPTIVQEALPYCSLASLAAIVLISGNMLLPTMMVVCPSRTQPIVQIVYLTALIFLCAALANSFGLIGFCWGTLFANIFRLILVFLFSCFYIKRNAVNE